MDDSDEMDLDNLEAGLDDMVMPNYSNNKLPEKEEEKVPEQIKQEAAKPDHRTIRRCGAFDYQKNAETGYTEVDNAYMTVKDKIGKGTFCKVKSAVCKVNRTKTDEVTGEVTKVPLLQELAVKIFNRKVLRGQKTSVQDPATGQMKMSDNLQTIYSEIKVWERVAHENIVKIFEIFDDSQHDDMYLLMELAKYG